MCACNLSACCMECKRIKEPSLAAIRWTVNWVQGGRSKAVRAQARGVRKEHSHFLLLLDTLQCANEPYKKRRLFEQRTGFDFVESTYALSHYTIFFFLHMYLCIHNMYMYSSTVGTPIYVLNYFDDFFAHNAMTWFCRETFITWFLFPVWIPLRNSISTFTLDLY